MTKRKNRRGYEGYRRTKTDGRNHILCSCGLTIKARGRTAHLRGTPHRQNKRIRKLLASNCITHTEIGSRLRITRERVRQIANTLEVDKGTDRRKACTLRRNLKTLENNSLLQSFIAKLDDNDIQHELVPHKWRDNSFFQSRLSVNDHVIDIRIGKQRDRYVQIRPPKTAHDFVVYQLPDKRWIVIPRNNLPASTTMFSLNPNPTGKGAGLNKRHDWRDYVEAWHLLK